jgi:uncharacterized membrane protein
MRTKVASLVMCVAAALATTLICPRAWSAPPSFQGLGLLPGGDRSEAFAVSNDGSVVVGLGRALRSGRSVNEAFRWTRDEGMQGLGFLSDFSDSFARGVSGDGLTIVGGSYVGSGSPQAFRWTSAEGMQSLGFSTGYLGGTLANATDGTSIAISGDGSTIVGARGADAFRWTSAGALERVHFPSTYSSANAVSADGSVFVGSYSSGIHGAFRWTSDGGFQDLGVGVGMFNPSANAVSADGSVVVGWNGSYAFRWTNAEGTQLLVGDPNSFSVGMGVSGDGSTMVGFSEEAFGAFIWDRTNGMRNLQQVLTSDYGLDLTDWTLQNATAISADGRTIVGFGNNPLGQREAWIATIPEPSSLLLLALGGILVSLFRLHLLKRSGYGIEE